MKYLNKFLSIISLICITYVFTYADTKTDTLPVHRSAEFLQTTNKMRRETQCVLYLLERGHYLKTPVSELDVREFVREYLKNIDFLKLFFTAADVQYFQDLYSPSIEIMLSQGTLLPAFDIYDNFLTRSEERLAWLKERMKQPFDLDSDKKFRPDRRDEEWPANIAEADNLWEARLTYDIINQMLGYDADAKKADEQKAENDDADTSDDSKDKEEIPRTYEEWTANIAEADNLWEARLTYDIINQILGYDADAKRADEQKAENDDADTSEDSKDKEEIPRTYEEKLAKAKTEVEKRYTRLIENYLKTEQAEVQEIYLNTLAKFYDPHTGFLSEYDLEEFDISVRNSLVGIGAVLKDEDGYCVINELMPGGPALDSNEIKPDDKIIAVGQETGEMVDVVGQKLRNTVKLIRGKVDTKVRLLIEPKSNPSARKTVTLVRKEIELTTKLAKAQLFTVPVGDKTVPIGVIDLPGFYGEGGSGDNSKGFSASKNVEELIIKLKKYNVQGIILDFRRNGGGFLNEAIDLAGLFIKDGPVVQVRDPAGRTNKLRDTDTKQVWDGPLIIMVSRLSASASEIVAGALQNHERAIIIGDKATHGKGTVQTVYNLSNLNKELKSAVKITIQKWYAPNGDSIQVRGVTSDIILPSVFDYMEIGEEFKDYPMKWDAINSEKLDNLWGYGYKDGSPLELLAKLNEKSKERQNSLAEFQILNDRIDWVKTRQEKKDWSLNYNQRELQLKADEAFNDDLNEREKLFDDISMPNEEILLDSAIENNKKDEALNPKSEKEKEKEAKDKEDSFDSDVQLHESLRIMADWIDLVEI